MKFSVPTSDFDELTDQQLDQKLRALQERALEERALDPSQKIDELEATIQELQVRKIEIEMQNRSLRETQEELESAVQRYADFYDNLPLAYLTVSRSGQITSANRAAIEFLQSDRRNVVGRFLGRYLDAYDSGRFAAHLEGCVQSGRPAAIELTLRAGAAQAIPVQLSSRRAPSAPGSEPRVHIAITDLSKLKEAQRVLGEVNREQEAFNYSISHDLRAPLITINNYAGIVLSDFGTQLDEQAKTMLERIRAASNRLEDTLKRLLEYSRLAHEEIVLQPVNADRIVADLLIELRAIIEQRNADILVDRPLPIVHASPDLLRRVIASLLTNALQYTQPRDNPKLHVFANEQEDKIVLCVVDQGIGIDPKYHERIFKVFERLHGYSRYPGSGVGLAVAKRAVERMNGRIWCESEPGRGSCFSVELPKAPTQ